MIDIRNPENPVEICLGANGQLWVNVDGKCVLRIYDGEYEIQDNRIFYYHHPESCSVMKVKGKLYEPFAKANEPIEEIDRETYLKLLDEYGQEDPDE